MNIIRSGDSFFRLLLISTALGGILFFVFIAGWAYYAEIGSRDIATNLLGGVSDSLSFIFGLPVSLAGSVVAIVLAQRSLSITERQEYYEVVRAVSSEIEATQNLYIDTGKKFRGFFAACECLIKVYVRRMQDPASRSNPDALNEFNLAADALISKRSELIESLIGLSSDKIGSRLIGQQEKSLLFRNIERGAREALPYNEQMLYEPEIETLSDLIFHIESFSFSNKPADLLVVLDGYFNPSACDQHMVLEDADGNRVRQAISCIENGWLWPRRAALLLYGSLLCNLDVEYTELNKVLGIGMIHRFRLNAGGCLITDFVKSIPKPLELTSAFMSGVDDLLKKNASIERFIVTKSSSIDLSMSFPKGYSPAIQSIASEPTVFLINTEYRGAES